MVVEITCAEDPKQQQAYFTTPDVRDEEENSPPKTFRHYRVTASDDSYETLAALLHRVEEEEETFLGDSSATQGTVKSQRCIFWWNTQDSDGTSFFCGYHPEENLDIADSSHPIRYVVSRFTVCSRKESHATAAVVFLASLPSSGREGLNICTEDRPHHRDLRSPLHCAFSEQQLQQLLHAGCAAGRTLRLYGLHLTPSQTHAIMTCDSTTIDLEFANCHISHWSWEAMTHRTKRFGSLSLNASAPSFWKGPEWNQFVEHLKQRNSILLDTLTFYGLELERALELFAARNSVQRLRLDNCLRTRRDVERIRDAIRSGQTPQRLSLFGNDFFNDDSDDDDSNDDDSDVDDEHLVIHMEDEEYIRDGRYNSNSHDNATRNHLAIIEALASPQCSLVEFGLGLGHSWNATVQDKFAESLKKNIVLEKLAFVCPTQCAFHNRKLTLAQAISKHAHIQALSFQRPMDYDREHYDLKRKMASCLPALKFLLESNRHFVMDWAHSWSSQWWIESLRPSIHFQRFWCGAWDQLSQLTTHDAQRCFALALLTGCRDTDGVIHPFYRAKKVSLVLHKHISLLKSTLELQYGSSATGNH